MATLPHFRAPLSLALAAACWLAIAPAHAADTTPADSPFELAMAAYENNHWRAAFEGLAVLADSGHDEAARLAWLMSRYGVAMYRTRLDADAARRQRWLALAASKPSVTVQTAVPALLTARLTP